jgi:hypothetical protein
MSQQRCTQGGAHATEVEPIVVSVKNACRLLSMSRTGLYRRIRVGAIDSFNDRGRRKIVLASIKRLIDEGLHKEISLRQARKLLLQAEHRPETAT